MQLSERTEKGWSEAKDPGEPFNPMRTMHISGTLDGTIYTTDISGDPKTGSDIYWVSAKIIEELRPKRAER